QVADGRPGLPDGLALQREDQPEDAVGRRVLRPHVDDDLLVRRPVRVTGDDLVPVLARHVVDAAYCGVIVAGRRGHVRSGHWYDLLSSGGGTLVPRYSTGMPPSG